MTVRRRHGFSSSEFIFRRAGEPASPSSLNLLSRMDAEFSARARCACLCGELVGAGNRPQGSRVFAENRWARGIGHRTRERHIRCAHPVSPEEGWRRNIAAYGAGRPILRAHDFRVPVRRRVLRACPAGNCALSGEKGEKGEEETEGAEESAAGARTCGGNMACVPGLRAGSARRVRSPGGLHPETAADAVTYFSGDPSSCPVQLLSVAPGMGIFMPND